jgi:hypothetical protein
MKPKLRKKLSGLKSSWTIWLNSIFLAVFPVLMYAQEMLPQLQMFLTDTTYKAVGLVVVILNILLRFRTDKCLSEK